MKKIDTAFMSRWRILCFLLLASIATAANAQIDMTHMKTERYDAYSVSMVNPLDSTFDLSVSFEGDKISSKEVYDFFFSQLDSIMYSEYGDKYDSKAQEALHKKMFKDLKKKNREAVKKRKKIMKEEHKKLKKAMKSPDLLNQYILDLQKDSIQ